MQKLRFIQIVSEKFVCEKTAFSWLYKTMHRLSRAIKFAAGHFRKYVEREFASATG